MRFWLCNLLSGGSEPIDFHTSLKYIPSYEQTELSKTIQRPRILKSHSPFNPRFANAIHIIRDPRSTYVSFYNYLKKSLPAGMTFSEFLRSDEMFPGKWHAHSLSWKQQPSVRVVVRYEDMLIDPRTQLERIVGAIPHLDPDDCQMNAAIANSSFEAMSAAEEAKGRPFTSKDAAQTATKFVRSGRSDEWREWFSPSDLEYLYQHAGVEMQRFGYEF